MRLHGQTLSATVALKAEMELRRSVSVARAMDRGLFEGGAIDLPHDRYVIEQNHSNDLA